MAGALLAGLALAAAFPPYDLVWLAPLAVALLVVVTYRRRFRSGFGMGFLAGLTFFAVLVRWLAVVGDDAWILLVAYCALWLGLVGGVTGLVTRLRWWPLWVACGWVGQEALRGRVPLGGFPWGRLAFAQTDTTLTPYAALAGAPAVTFATALAGALVAAVVIAWRPGLVAAAPGLGPRPPARRARCEDAAGRSPRPPRACWWCAWPGCWCPCRRGGRTTTARPRRRRRWSRATSPSWVWGSTTRRGPC